MLMPLAPYWDARACRRAFACVYYDTILEVEGKLRAGKVRAGRSGSCMRGTAMRNIQHSSDRRVGRRCMSLATLAERGIDGSPKSKQWLSLEMSWRCSTGPGPARLALHFRR